MEEIKKSESSTSTKKCPHCQKEVDALATKCPYCQSDLRSRLRPNPLLITLSVLAIVGVVVAIILAGAGVGSNKGTTSAQELNANIATNAEGVVVTNNESVAWNGCEVGVDGACLSPSYATHGPLSVVPGQTLTVPYSSMSDKSGVTFDSGTQVVNSITVMCFVNTPSLRAVCGTPKSQ